MLTCRLCRLMSGVTLIACYQRVSIDSLCREYTDTPTTYLVFVVTLIACYQRVGRPCRDDMDAPTTYLVSGVIYSYCLVYNAGTFFTSGFCI